TRPISCPGDRYVAESRAPTPQGPPGLSSAAEAAVVGQAHRGLLGCAWQKRYPDRSNPHLSPWCSFSFYLSFGASSMIQGLLSAPVCLQLCPSSLFTRRRCFTCVGPLRGLVQTHTD